MSEYSDTLLAGRPTVAAPVGDVNRGGETLLPPQGAPATLTPMPWHPMFVHFPIALLTAAVLVDVAALICCRQTWHRVAYALLVAGTVAAAASVVSGTADAGAYRQTEVAAAIQDHEDLGTATFLLFLVMVLGRLPGILRPAAEGRRWVWVVAGVAGLVLLYLTSYHGGLLVYDEGVGVGTD